MHVVVLFNQPVLPSGHPQADSEEWVATAVEDISTLLVKTGFRVTKLGIGRKLAALKRQLTVCRPDVVFNLFEGHADRPETEIMVARLLERLQIPFTGSSSKSLWLSLNKHLAKRRFRAGGIPMPRFRVINELPLKPAAIRWPAIVKPARRDASEGIDQGSVVTNWTALARRVAAVFDEYGPPVLIEQFVSGREFTVALIEAPEFVALPISEVLFTTSPVVPWPILSYAAKWHPGSPDYEATDMQKAVPLEPELSQSLVDLAKRAYRAMGCRDYARIDLRLNSVGEPLVLEVNANPDLSPTACFAKALEVAGVDRRELIARLVRQAAGRRAVTADFVNRTRSDTRARS